MLLEILKWLIKIGGHRNASFIRPKLPLLQRRLRLRVAGFEEGHEVLNLRLQVGGQGLDFGG